MRAVSAQPSRQLSTLRQSTRVTSFQISKPSVYRSFQQASIWRAEERKEEASPALAETTNETVTEESSVQDEAIKEESILTPEAKAQSQEQPSAAPSGQPEHAQDAVSESSGTTSVPLGQPEAEPHTTSETASTLAEKAKETVNDTLSAGAEAAQKNLSNSAQEVVSNATEKVQDALSSVTDAAQNTFSAVTGAAAGDASTAFARDQRRQKIDPSRILYVGNLFFDRNDVVSIGQFVSVYAPPQTATAPDYKGRVFDLTGEQDQAFCGPGSPVIGPADCGPLLQQAGALFPAADYNWRAVNSTGHAIQLAYSAQVVFTLAHEFLAGQSFKGGIEPAP